jgi:hypothetical protein
MRNKHGINDLLICYSGDHTSISGRRLKLTPEGINKMADNINSFSSEHLPKAGVLFHKKIMKAGHGNTLVKHTDVPSVGDIKKARARDMTYKGARVTGLFTDIENIPDGFYRMYKGGGFPAVSAEIVPDYEGQGPMLRAAAFQGMVPPAMKGQSPMDIYSSLFSEGEEKEASNLSFCEEKDEVCTLNFSEYKEIQEEDSMNDDDIKKLVADSIKAAMSGLGKDIQTGIVAQFAEFAKKDAPPERTPEDQAEFDRLNTDITRRDTEDRNKRVVRFGELLESLKERDVGGVMKGLAPALMEDIKTYGTALADPESQVVKFAECESQNILDGFGVLIKRVAEAKPLNFSEINVTGDGKNEIQKDFEAGAAVHKR